MIEEIRKRAEFWIAGYVGRAEARKILHTYTCPRVESIRRDLDVWTVVLTGVPESACNLTSFVRLSLAMDFGTRCTIRVEAHA